MAIVETDVHCIQCGYNLRTLERDATCPECGASVAESVLHDEAARAGRGVPLRRADARWVKSLGRACLLLLAAAAVDLALGFHIVLGWNESPDYLPTALLIPLYVLPDALAWAGLMGLARGEPTAKAGASRRLRFGLRAAACASFGVFLLMVWLSLLGRGQAVMSWQVFLLKSASDAAATTLAFAYLRRLAARLEPPTPRRHATALAWLAPLLLVPGVFEQFRFFRTADVYYGVLPAPVFGHVQTLAPSVRAVFDPQTWAYDRIVWLVLSAWSAWAVAAVFRFYRAFKRARAGTAGRTPASCPQESPARPAD